MPLVSLLTLIKVSQPAMNSLLASWARSAGNVFRLGANVRSSPGWGKSITSGGLPPWISTGAWTSNWSVPWKSILTPVHSLSGFQKSVKIWMAFGSLALLRTGDRRLTVFPAYYCLQAIFPSSKLSPTPVLPVAPAAAVVALPAAVVALPAAVVALAAVVSLDFLSSLPHAAATRSSDDAIAIDATRLLDLMLVIPLCEPVPGGSAARSSRRPGGRLLPSALEMVWNLVEDSGDNLTGLAGQGKTSSPRSRSSLGSARLHRVRGVRTRTGEVSRVGDIVLSDVDKVYENGFHAVHKLSLEVADGEFLVLVGPSGCGKSTALRMIAGLESITSGQVAIGGRLVNDLEPKDRDIAMVFQSYALYPHLTVRDNIAFALKLRKVPKPEINERVEHAARILELTDFLDRKPAQLSGGQRQRVAMGRAIVR